MGSRPRMTREEMEKRNQQNLLLARDIGLALGIVFTLFLVAYLYTGNWPPVVVIESGSMEHPNDDGARLGTIDTGDLVLAKKVEDDSDITTWMAGKQQDEENYENFGDVIIFDKNGAGGTPVIHRAMVWVEVNPTDGTYYIPILDQSYDDQEGITIEEIGAYNVGQSQRNGGPGVLKWSGYLTKGDSVNNNHVDQIVLKDARGDLVQPVKMEFILGKARGELPWMGMLKLCLTGAPGCESAPDHQKRYATMVILIIVGSLVVLTFYPSIAAALFPTKAQDKEKSHQRTNRPPPRKTPPRNEISGPPPNKGPPRK